MHHRVKPELLRSLIPPELEVDLFDGSAWISVVPFVMADVMKGNLPSVYPMKAFPELNIRTYVKHRGRPGVWFFSLDAACLPLVLGGRYMYGVPYHYAAMRLEKTEETYLCESRRRFSKVEFRASYTPDPQVFLAEPGSFEYWVTERYCMYAKPWYGSLYRVDVHHRQWPLQQLQVDEYEADALLRAVGLDQICGEHEFAHFSAGVEVVTFPLCKLVAAGAVPEPCRSMGKQGG